MNNEELKNLVHKHRDEYAAVLEFFPRIEKLVDGDHCKEIEKFVHSHGAVWEKQSATSDLSDVLPKEKGIYMFVWMPAFNFCFGGSKKEASIWILYVGKAGVDDGTHDTIRNRYQSEYRKYIAADQTLLWDDSPHETRELRLKKFLNLWPLQFWYLPLGGVSNKNIELIEKQLIRLFNPPLNTIHTRRLRPSKTEPAF